MQHLHTDYERELVPLFVKVLRDLRFSRSKLDEDAIDRVEIVAFKLYSQLYEQRDLLFVEGSAVEIVSIRNLYAPTVASGCFNRVRTHEYRYVTADRPPGNIELKCQIVVCIAPPTAQYLQQLLPPFAWTAHALTPFRCSWGDAKNLMGRILAHFSKFAKKNLGTRLLCIMLPPKSECDGGFRFSRRATAPGEVSVFRPKLTK